MREIITDWVPRNEITTPLQGEPVFVNSGIIKAVMQSGERISIGQIDYQEFPEEEFQYVISPYWEIIDGLPASIFQGIPGIDMELRLKSYYRVNYVPVFITERTPSENREDLWELLKEVNLDYYDRFEWLLRTKLRAANDNLIVERRREEGMTCEYTGQAPDMFQYGDTIIVDSFDNLAGNMTDFNDALFFFATNGINVIDRQGKNLLGAAERIAVYSVLLTQRRMMHQNKTERRKNGIEAAKQAGRYKGRKPIDVDMHMLQQVAKELDKKIITVEEAMRRTGIASRSTFYRKLKIMKEEDDE